MKKLDGIQLVSLFHFLYILMHHLGGNIPRQILEWLALKNDGRVETWFCFV